MRANIGIRIGHCIIRIQTKNTRMRGIIPAATAMGQAPEASFALMRRHSPEDLNAEAFSNLQ